MNTIVDLGKQREKKANDLWRRISQKEDELYARIRNLIDGEPQGPIMNALIRALVVTAGNGRVSGRSLIWVLADEICRTGTADENEHWSEEFASWFMADLPDSKGDDFEFYHINRRRVSDER